jgi:hypothetical protein
VSILQAKTPSALPSCLCPNFFGTRTQERLFSHDWLPSAEISYFDAVPKRRTSKLITLFLGENSADHQLHLGSPGNRYSSAINVIEAIRIGGRLTFATHFGILPQVIKTKVKNMQRVEKMQTSSVKIGSRVMYTMGLYALVMSLFWIFLTEMIFMSDFLSYTGQSYADYLASSPKPAELYIVTKKLWGIMMLLISLLIIFINQKSYSKGEKWSWYALLITGIMLWGSLIGYRIVIGYIAPSIVTFIIGTALFLIGIALPAKEILS